MFWGDLFIAPNLARPPSLPLRALMFSNQSACEFMAEKDALASNEDAGFVRGLGLFDSTMIVAGAMIGSGIFIVPADIGRQVGSPDWLLVVWLVTGVLTLIASPNYGELAAMMAIRSVPRSTSSACRFTCSGGAMLRRELNL